jgi:hypothetical protein
MPASLPKVRAAWPEVAAPSHPVAGALEGIGHHAEHRGLARAGHALDKLRPSPRGADGQGGGTLGLAELPTQAFLRPAGGLCHLALADCGRVPARQLSTEALGDGVLPGEHACQGVDALPGPSHADERHRLGVGQGSLDQGL